jgi:hypoxanthine phosphoribosyltransferase
MMTKFKDLPKIFFLGFYHPIYNYYDDCYEDNEWFNEFSANILNLKNKHSSAIDFFLEKLKALISDDEVIVTTVPSHSCNISSSGIRDLAQKLVQSKKGFIDGTLYLERFKSIDKLSNSFNKRSIETHLNSIKVSHPELVKDKQVILMDDVLTTGCSLEACKKLLLGIGAKEVKIIVLGKTIRNLEELHYFIDQKCGEFIERDPFDIIIEYEGWEDEYGQIIEDEYGNPEYLEIEHYMDNEYWYKDCANEAHNAIEGTDSFRPHNPFIPLLLKE